MELCTHLIFGEYTLGNLSRACVGNFPLGNNLFAFATFDFHQGKFFCVRLLYQQGGVFLLFFHSIYLFILFGEKVQGDLLLAWNVNSNKGP